MPSAAELKRREKSTPGKLKNLCTGRNVFSRSKNPGLEDDRDRFPASRAPNCFLCPGWSWYLTIFSHRLQQVLQFPGKGRFPASRPNSWAVGPVSRGPWQSSKHIVLALLPRGDNRQWIQVERHCRAKAVTCSTSHASYDPILLHRSIAAPAPISAWPPSSSSSGSRAASNRQGPTLRAALPLHPGSL